MNFPVRHQPVGGNRHMKVATATCGHCGCIKTVNINDQQGISAGTEVFEQRFVEKKLTMAGWLVGKKPSQHRCAGCYSAIKSRQAAKNAESKIVTLHPNPEPTSASRAALGAPAREMQREDRSIILSKLVEVYADEKTGYGDGWTDNKVATHLGVPRAWVAKLREENFGPEGNEDIRAAVTEAKQILDEIKKHGKAAETLTSLLKSLLSKAEQIDKSLLQIQKDLR